VVEFPFVPDEDRSFVPCLPGRRTRPGGPALPAAAGGSTPRAQPSPPPMTSTAIAISRRLAARVMPVIAYGGQFTELPATVRISREAAFEALKEFMETGQRPKWIEGEEI
jgi:hypothetical protein